MQVPSRRFHEHHACALDQQRPPAFPLPIPEGCGGRYAKRVAAALSAAAPLLQLGARAVQPTSAYRAPALHGIPLRSVGGQHGAWLVTCDS